MTTDNALSDEVEDGLTVDELASDSTDAGDAPGRRRLWRMRWVFTRRLCFGGLVFCLSMTPSLLRERR